MRIALDMQGYQCASQFRGIGRACICLGEAIARLATGEDIFILLNRNFPDSIDSLVSEFGKFVPAHRIVALDLPRSVSANAATHWGRIPAAEQTYAEAVAALNPDVLFIQSLFEGFVDDVVIGMPPPPVRNVVLLHDLIPFQDPSAHLINGLHRAWYGARLAQLRKADLVLTNSEWTRNQAIKLLGFPSDKTKSVSMASPSLFAKSDVPSDLESRLRAKFGIHGQFVLSTGVVEPRKNFTRLVEAFFRTDGQLPDGCKLVVAGQNDTLEANRLRALIRAHRNGAERVVLTGYVSDEDLLALYNLATLFVLPSLDEGFGLPALEAMACGTPTIGSKAASIPEVIGSEDALFDPLSTVSIALRLTQALTDSDYQADLRRHARTRAKCFSWDKSGALALGAFRSLRHSETSGTTA